MTSGDTLASRHLRPLHQKPLLTGRVSPQSRYRSGIARLIPMLVVLLCGACATPKTRPVDPVAPPPAIVAPSGALNMARAEQLIDRRLGDEHDDPHVRELIDAFRAQADAPLVSGNRVELLIDGPQTLKA